MSERIVLVGMMGSGKTTIGTLLADHLGWAYIDSDDLVTQRAGMPVTELLRRAGRAVLHGHEADVIDEVIATAAPVVASVGAGTVLHAANRAKLGDNAKVVWLRVSRDTIERRNREADKPLPQDDEPPLDDFVADRERYYEQVADLTVDADHAPPEEVLSQILGWLGRTP